jgi:osmotically-inducible protein OsmY
MAERTDDYVAAHVQEALARDPRVNEPELEVQVVNGRVFVTGVVPTNERRDAIEAVVHDVSPDFDVENQTTVARYPEAGEPEHVG